MDRRWLQVVLAGIGSVATLAGAQGLARGVGGVLRGGRVSANIDSEYRFHASWYGVLGVLLLLAARRPEEETRIVRACSAGFLAAAMGRLLSWASVGRPHPWFLFLLGLELAIPGVIVPWQHRVAREASRRRGRRPPDDVPADWRG
jgi:hypothetical protein